MLGGTERISSTSVEVLPLRTIGDTTLRLPADAVVEEVKTALAMDTTLRVREVIRDVTANLEDISAYSVHGAVQRNGSRIRVTLRLVDNADGVAVWAGSFDAEEENQVELMRRGSTDVAIAIRQRIAER
jgi:TolB-like protein